MVTTVRDLLRDFHRHGIRVELLPDCFRLHPSGAASDALRLALRDLGDEVAAVLAELPAANRCRVCGEASRRPVGPENHCVTCALIVADRRGWTVYAPEEEVDHAA